MDFLTNPLLRFLGKECNCPYCGRAGARAFWLVAKCRNPNCRRFSTEYAQRFERRKQTGQGFPPANSESQTHDQPASLSLKPPLGASKEL